MISFIRRTIRNNITWGMLAAGCLDGAKFTISKYVILLFVYFLNNKCFHTQYHNYSGICYGYAKNIITFHDKNLNYHLKGKINIFLSCIWEKINKLATSSPHSAFRAWHWIEVRVGECSRGSYFGFSRTQHSYNLRGIRVSIIM